MGITVTSNLQLIKPDANEKIKQQLPTFNGWPKQNELNCTAIDNLFRASSTTYSPTLTATTTSPTLGAGGSVTGKYFRLMPRMVWGHIMYFAGTAGFVAGSGDYRFSLPVAINAQIAALSIPVTVGKAIFFDNSAVATSGTFNVYYQGGFLFCRTSTGAPWGAAAPVVADNNDRVALNFMYPTDVP